MENSVDCVAISQNSPDRDFGTKSNKINQNLCKLLIGFVFAILFASFIASAQSSFYGTSNQGSARFTTYQSDFRDYYSSSQIRDYWPILGNDRQICEGRQDLLIQVAPLGCQPSVVRSDLLAEQNVPVFCQLDAIRLNPLLDIKQIRNIRFTGN